MILFCHELVIQEYINQQLQQPKRKQRHFGPSLQGSSMTNPARSVDAMTIDQNYSLRDCLAPVASFNQKPISISDKKNGRA